MYTNLNETTCIVAVRSNIPCSSSLSSLSETSSSSSSSSSLSSLPLCSFAVSVSLHLLLLILLPPPTPPSPCCCISSLTSCSDLLLFHTIKAPSLLIVYNYKGRKNSVLFTYKRITEAIQYTKHQTWVKYKHEYSKYKYLVYGYDTNTLDQLCI